VRNKIIIAATSARAYAEHACAFGVDVVAIDAFADADLKSIASEVYQVKMQDWQIDIEDFKRQFLKINLANVQGFCYGSLFDAVPEMLNWVSTRVPIFGNSAETLKSAKSYRFFSLLDRLHIGYPMVRLDCPKKTDGWLSKSLGGFGGTHVRYASQHDKGDYFQQEIIGKPVSMLFVANGKEIQIIGFNQQLIAPTLQLPYRYAGAVGSVKLPDSVMEVFCSAAEQLTNEMGLLGINSLDAVLREETLFILELNPRLSATFELYPNLWDVHLQACNGIMTSLPKYNASRAKMTIFADADMEVKTDFAWPNWTVDLPSQDLASNRILKDAPICTVLGEAETAELAYVNLLERTKQLWGIMK
jgi:uncharacterized protein